jgi:hypothetical protein
MGQIGLTSRKAKLLRGLHSGVKKKMRDAPDLLKIKRKQDFGKYFFRDKEV